MEEKTARCKYVVIHFFDSFDEAAKCMEEANRTKEETGVVNVEIMERRVVKKASDLIKRKKEKQREKSVVFNMNEFMGA